MHHGRIKTWGWFARPLSWLMLVVLCACEPQVPDVEEEPILHLYNWASYLPLHILKDFEKATGIKVILDVYDSNEMLEAKLLTGHSGYDVVCPTAFPYLVKQIEAGVYEKLDRAQLPHWEHLDRELMKRLEAGDPGNQYAVPYLWGTGGFGYNKKCLAKLGLTQAVTKLHLIFDPTIALKIRPYGFSLIDSPYDVFPMALLSVGRDPTTENPEDLTAAMEVLMRLRPAVTHFSSLKFISDLATGEVCVAQGWSGDVRIAMRRAKEARNGVELGFAIPEEGAELWCDVWAIPKRAPHPRNAHKFLNYMMDPRVIAHVSNYMCYANGNQTSRAYLDPQVRDDPMIYPPAALRAKLYVAQAQDATFERLQTRLWTRLKTVRVHRQKA